MTQAVKTEHCHVHRDPAVCGGDPVIVGTRIPVRLIYQRTQEGDSIDQIRQAYPHLTLAQIHDALSYSYDHLADIQAELRREARAWEQPRADPSH